LIEHHEAKDQFLRVAVKRLSETQLFEDELKEVSQLNTVLLAHNQELEARLAEESKEKTGKCFTNFLFYDKTQTLLPKPSLTKKRSHYQGKQ
jgi:hypothetical protein